MIRLSKLTDYAVAVMAELARDHNSAPLTPRSAAWLSERGGVPEPTVAKILKILSRQQLIVSSRGAAGGYRLARPAEDISIADIVEAMEGPITIASCLEGDITDCVAGHRCRMRSVWDQVNQAIRAALCDVTLAGVAKGAVGVHGLKKHQGQGVGL